MRFDILAEEETVASVTNKLVAVESALALQEKFEGEPRYKLRAHIIEGLRQGTIHETAQIAEWISVYSVYVENEASNSLANWLSYVLGDLGIYEPKLWGHVLGASTADVEAWMNGLLLPPPVVLSDIVFLFEEYYRSRFGVVLALSTWETLSNKFFEEVTKCKPAPRYNHYYATLRHYVLAHLWELIHLNVGTLPIEEQEQVLNAFQDDIVQRRNKHLGFE